MPEVAQRILGIPKEHARKEVAEKARALLKQQFTEAVSKEESLKPLDV